MFIDLKQTNKQINQDSIRPKFIIFLTPGRPLHDSLPFFEGPQTVIFPLSLSGPYLLFLAHPKPAGIVFPPQVLVLVFAHVGNSVARAPSGGQICETKNGPALTRSRGGFYAGMISEHHGMG